MGETDNEMVRLLRVGDSESPKWHSMRLSHEAKVGV